MSKTSDLSRMVKIANASNEKLKKGKKLDLSNFKQTFKKALDGKLLSQSQNKLLADLLISIASDIAEPSTHAKILKTINKRNTVEDES
jgi:hypothetical protein